MRHYKKGRKLGTDASHTAAIKKNLMVNLFLNDRIKTTLERAKEIRGDVDRIITWAKRGDVHSRRLAIAKLGDKQLVAEIFAKVEQGLFKDRPGGYTRIYKVGKRRGDDAIIVLMELVQEPVQFKNKAAAEETTTKGGLKVEKKAKKDKNAEKGDEANKDIDANDDTDEAAESVSEVAGAAAPEDTQAHEASPTDGTEDKETAEEESAVKAEETSAEKSDETNETPAEEVTADESPEAEEAPAEDESNK